MYLGLFILNVYVVAGVSAYYTVLIANKYGIHVFDPTKDENKTVLPFHTSAGIHSNDSWGANSVQFDFKTRFVYGIVESNTISSPTKNRIVRTKIVEPHEADSCGRDTIPSQPEHAWCIRNGHCVKVCSTNNPYIPEKMLEPKGCVKANNLMLDWVNNNFYWSCDPYRSAGSSLNRAAIGDKEGKTIFSGSKPIESVDIDPYERILFILESNNLQTTTLEGKSKGLYQFDKDVTTLSLDIQQKIIYAIVKTNNNGEVILARLNYELSDYEEIYKSKETEFRQVRPKIVNKALYWLTSSHGHPWEAVTETKLEMETIVVPYEVDEWSLVHLDVQKPADGHVCIMYGCSHGCYHSQWMKVTCQCPPNMALSPDNKTCHEVQLPSPNVNLESSLPQSATTSASNGGKQDVGPTDKNKAVDSHKSPQNTDPTMIVSTPSNRSGDPEVVVNPVNTPSASVESAVNGPRDLAESAVDSSLNTTETAGAVTASASNMTLFHIVVATTFISIFIVVVIVRRRAKKGNYQPAGSTERTDFSLR